MPQTDEQAALVAAQNWLSGLDFEPEDVRTLADLILAQRREAFKQGAELQAKGMKAALEIILKHPKKIEDVEGEYGELLKRVVRETQITALEWAKINVQPYGGTGIAMVLDAEIERTRRDLERLKGEENAL